MFGGCTRTRTADPLIKSQLLYQLSYTPAAGGTKQGRTAPFYYQSPPCLSSAAVASSPRLQMLDRKSEFRGDRASDGLQADNQLRGCLNI